MTTIKDMQTELTDRFGPLPHTVQNLIFQMQVKLLAQKANVSAIASENGQVSIRLPYLAGVDRPALQEDLGHGVRVSRTSVWLPEDGLEDVVWQANLLEVLEKLQVNLIQDGVE